QIGKRAFVRFAAPGELVRIRIDKEEKRFLEGSVEQIIEPSPQRTSPPCHYFSVCGGCDLQHIDIATQRELKRAMVESTLYRQGGVTPRRGVMLSSAELPHLAYRRRATLHLSEAGPLGFYQAGSGVVVPIESCQIVTPALNSAITDLHRFTEALKAHCGAVVLEEDATGKVSILLVPRVGAEQRLSVPPELKGLFQSTRIKGQVDSSEDEALGHFSQVNAVGNAELIRLILGYVTHPHVTDLYAGSGNFSFPLARAGKTVAAVELDPALVATGIRCAKEQKIPSVTFTNASCEKYCKQHTLQESVVLDPPRSGARDVVKRFDPARTKEVVYVSCNLPSLVRDLKILSERGYTLQETVVVDMFPQTHHVETVNLLTAG
ncbi:MAG: class I SAM-dependent RNA methyltransferase, partial [Proteobacteria bacterium]|nr:class I SAM-dependent RNA methyltransferase [Pseudomonadota bacterium]